MNSSRKADLKALVAAAVVFAVLFGLLQAEIIGPFWELNLVLIGINIILATSLNMINGYTGQFSIGHAGFLAVGAYVGAIMTVKLGFGIVPALVVGTVAAGFLGFLIGLPTLRLNGDYLAIATLGLGEIIRICILNIDYVGGAAGLMGIPRLTTFPMVFWIMIAILFFIKNFKNSAHGRACLAIRENEIAADTMGIDTTKYKVMAFTLGAAFAGTAGVLFPTTFHRPSGVLHLHAVLRHPDHGRPRRPGVHDGVRHGRHRPDLYFRRLVRFPAVAHDHLFRGHDRPHAVPAPGPLWQQGILHPHVPES